MTHRNTDCLDILRKLRLDNVSSSTQILLSMMDCAIEIFGHSLLKNLIYEIIKNQSSMAAVINIGFRIIDAIESGKKEDVYELKNEIESSLNQVREETARYLSGVRNLSTISYSQIVFDTICEIKPKNVFLSVSHPAREGEKFALKLKQNGIEPVLFEDSAYSLILRDVDAVLVGADAIFDDSFFNKTGTLSLALLAREFEVPFYVESCFCKYLNKEKKKFFSVEHKPESEISSVNCKRINMYFEEIPLKFVDKIFVR